MLSAKDRSMHMYVVGSTGVGKSKFLEHIVREDIRNWRKSGCGLHELWFRFIPLINYRCTITLRLRRCPRSSPSRTCIRRAPHHVEHSATHSAGYTHQGRVSRSKSRSYRPLHRAAGYDNPSPADLLSVTIKSAVERRIWLDGRIEGGEESLKVCRRQGDGLMGLHDLFGRSQGVREHKFGHADMRIGGGLVE